MSTVINTNVASINAQRQLGSTNKSMQQALTRLSSGLRINSAKDDAAGMAISQKFTAQIRGLNQAIRNSNDGISMLQTAEGALGEIGNNVQRIRELVVQAANGTNDQDARKALQLEIDERLEEITRIADKTEFNGQVLLNGAFTAGGANSGGMNFQIGANSGDQIQLTIDAAGTGALGLTGAMMSVSGGSFSGGAADTLLNALDSAIDTVNSQRATMGAMQSRMEAIVSNATITVENLEASRSRILDADFAAETAQLTRAQILQQAGVSVLAQANMNSQSVLSLLG